MRSLPNLIIAVALCSGLPLAAQHHTIADHVSNPSLINPAHIGDDVQTFAAGLTFRSSTNGHFQADFRRSAANSITYYTHSSPTIQRSAFLQLRLLRSHVGRSDDNSGLAVGLELNRMHADYTDAKASRLALSSALHQVYGKLSFSVGAQASLERLGLSLRNPEMFDIGDSSYLFEAPDLAVEKAFTHKEYDAIMAQGGARLQGTRLDWKLGVHAKMTFKHFDLGASASLHQFMQNPFDSIGNYQNVHRTGNLIHLYTEIRLPKDISLQPWVMLLPNAQHTAARGVTCSYSGLPVELQLGFAQYGEVTKDQVRQFILGASFGEFSAALEYQINFLNLHGSTNTSVVGPLPLEKHNGGALTVTYRPGK